MCLRRAPARVGDEHVAYRHAGALARARAARRRARSSLQRLEPIEERLEHDAARRNEQRHDAAPLRARRPAATTTGRRGSSPSSATIAGAVSSAPIAKPFALIDRPAAAGLRREPPAPLAHEAPPVRERQPHELDDGQHEHRAERPRAPTRPVASRHTAGRRASRTRATPSQRVDEHDVCGQSEVERPVIAPGPGDLVGSERNRRIHGFRTSRVSRPATRLHP